MPDDFTYYGIWLVSLKKHCQEIEENSDVKNLIDNMFETMYASSGVGLAGPQIESL